ncbi:MAG: AAA family ATPase, partial [Nitriliruptorales bacterium]
MRPLRLVLENFGSFRGRHEVDFEGIDLFVLAGPTGAGKSTILDAVSCALYSSIARYEQQNLIEPAINKLATQATVSFTFAVGGERYVVTRVLRRTSSGGAHAAEVRLERVVGDGETTTIASGSREVAEHVQRLLGLTFEEFCRTVVLPQGAFARFLHGGAKERQDLLVRLLGLDVFRTLGQRARVLARGLETEVGSIATQLDELGDLTDAHVAAEERRAAGLADTRRHVVEDLWPALDELKEAGADARAGVDEAGRVVAALEAIEEPVDVGAIDGRIREAEDAVGSAREALTAARERLGEARAASEALPARRPVEELLRIDEEVGTQQKSAAELGEKAAALAAGATDAVARVERAEREAAENGESLAALREAHLAHTLAEGLGAGDECPVCLRPVDDLPAHPEPEGLE